MGSEIQAALRVWLVEVLSKEGLSYKTAMAMYGVELTKPMSQEFLLQSASEVQ